MRKFLLAAALALVSMPAFAADPTPAPDKTTPVQMTMLDLQVAAVAIANAGAGCDGGVKNLCQIISVRDATLAKIQAAVAVLQQPPPPAVKK